MAITDLYDLQNQTSDPSGLLFRRNSDSEQEQTNEVALRWKTLDELGHKCGECLVDAHVARILELLEGYSLPVEIAEWLKEKKLSDERDQAHIGHKAVTAASRANRELASDDQASLAEMQETRHELKLHARILGWKNLEDELDLVAEELDVGSPLIDVLDAPADAAGIAETELENQPPVAEVEPPVDELALNASADGLYVDELALDALPVAEVKLPTVDVLDAPADAAGIAETELENQPPFAEVEPPTIDVLNASADVLSVDELALDALPVAEVKLPTVDVLDAPADAAGIAETELENQPPFAEVEPPTIDVLNASADVLSVDELALDALPVAEVKLPTVDVLDAPADAAGIAETELENQPPVAEVEPPVDELALNASADVLSVDELALDALPVAEVKLPTIDLLDASAETHELDNHGLAPVVLDQLPELEPIDNVVLDDIDWDNVPDATIPVAGKPLASIGRPDVQHIADRSTPAIPAQAPKVQLPTQLTEEYSSRLEAVALSTVSGVMQAVRQDDQLRGLAARRAERINRLRLLAAEVQRQRLVQARLSEDDKNNLIRAGVPSLVSISNSTQPSPFASTNANSKETNVWVYAPNGTQAKQKQNDGVQVNLKTAKEVKEEREAEKVSVVKMCGECNGEMGCCPVDNSKSVADLARAKMTEAGVGLVDSGPQMERTLSPA